MNIRQIEIFKAIMESGSVTGAASQLNIAQPSVSKHLKLLEYDLDIALFERNGNKLVPTPEGQALFDQVQRVYTGLGYLEKFATDLRNSQHGEVSIAAMPLISQNWLPEHMADFINKHEHVFFSLPVRSSNWIWSAVAAQRVHLGIGLKPAKHVKGLSVVPLMKLPVVCVMPQDHELTQYDYVSGDHTRDYDLVSLRNFDQERLNLEFLTEQYSQGGNRVIETFSTNMVCQLVRHGVGIGLVDALSMMDNLDDKLTFRPFSPTMHIEVCVMTSDHWPLPLIAKSLIDELQGRAQQTQDKISAFLAT